MVFHGRGPLYLGLELELHCPDERVRADAIEIAAAGCGALAYLTAESSVRDGFELVTHPMGFAHAVEHFPWHTLDDLRALGCYTDHTAGIHIHLSRSGFDDRDHIYRWLRLIYRNQGAVTALARRESTEWARFCPQARRTLRWHDNQKRRHASRRQAVNITPADTLELRVFASSLHPHQVQAALAFAEASVEYTRDLHAYDIIRGAWDWDRFTTWVTDRRQYSALAAEMTTLDFPAITPGPALGVTAGAATHPDAGTAPTCTGCR